MTAIEIYWTPYETLKKSKKVSKMAFFEKIEKMALLARFLGPSWGTQKMTNFAKFSKIWVREAWGQKVACSKVKIKIAKSRKKYIY